MSADSETAFPALGDSDSTQRDHLIESIYRIALEPQAYDSFMGQWDTYISDQLVELNELKFSDGTQLQTASHPEIETHFQIAAQLLDQIGRPDPEPKDRSGARNPKMLIDSNGRIVWSSSAASKIFALGPIAQIDQLPLDATQLAALREMTQSLATDQSGTNPLTLPSPVLVKLTSQITPPDMIYMVARILPEQHGSDVVLLTTISPDWPPAMVPLLKDGFALSDSEIEICELVADGLNPLAISQARKSALATVRTQIKKIMGKTHCGSQAELVRLLHSVMRVAEHSGQKSSPDSPNAPRETLITLADRTMPVEHFGDPNGYPVIFFHGLLDGIPMTRAFQEELKRHNLHMICPVRPFFGFAAGASGPPKTAPERFAQDVALMMDQMGLKKPILLGYMAGMVYAQGLASHLPNDSLAGILGIASAVPIVSSSQFSSMSRRQRLVGYTARYTPRILPFVIRAGISQMDRGGSSTFMHSLYENSPNDLALSAVPETRDAIFAGYRFTVQQGHRAFEIESHTIVQNWSHLVNGSNVKVRLLHGRDDPASHVKAVENFAQRYSDRVSLDVWEDTGQLILYKDPRRVVAELCMIRDHGVQLA